MAIRGSPVVKDVYLDEKGNEMLSEDLAPSGGGYLDDQGNEIPAPQINIPSPKKSREQLLAEHQKNLLAQPQPQKIIEENGKRRVADIAPSQIDLGIEVLKAPIRLAEGVGSLAKTAYKIGTRPSDPKNAMRLASLPYEMAEGAVDTGRKALGVYATPKEQAGAIGDIAAEVVLPEVPSMLKKATIGTEFSAGVLPRLAQRSIANHMTRGKNQLITALDASEHTASAMDNVIGDINAHTKATGRVYRDLPSFASVAKNTTDAFVKANYEPIQKALKDVPEFTALEQRGAELNDILGRLGYYDKNPLMQSFARSSPEVQKVVSEANAVRAQRNALIDQMAPVNVGAANLMRKWADLRQVSDMADIAAKANEHSKRMVSARAPGRAASRVAELVAAATSIGMGQPQIALAVRALKMGMNQMQKAPAALNPDILVARASRNLSKGQGAIAQPIPIKAEPIKLPGAQSANRINPEGQVELPFVEPEVGGIPQEITPEAQLPLFQTHGDVAREAARRQAHYEQVIPQRRQLALPPRRGGPVVPSGAEPINLPERPARLALPEPRIVDESPVPPVAGPKQPRERTPRSREEELMRNFGGQIRTAPASKAPTSTTSSSSSALEGPILPVQLPYPGPERRLAGRAQSFEANATHNALRQAQANPEIAKRAAAIKDAFDEAEARGNVNLMPNLHNELTTLVEQYPWISDYLPTRNVVKGGPRQ